MEEPTDVLHVLAAGEPFFDGGVLAGQPDPLTHTVRVGDDIDAVDRGVPGIGTQQGGQHSHGRGLARPVGPEQTVDRPARHLEVDAVECQRVAEPFHEATRLDCQICHVAHSGERV